MVKELPPVEPSKEQATIAFGLSILALIVLLAFRAILP